MPLSDLPTPSIVDPLRDDEDLVEVLVAIERKRKMLKSLVAHLQSRNESKVLQDRVRGLARGLSNQLVDILKARYDVK